MKRIATTAGRADAAVAEAFPGTSRRRLAALFAAKQVRVNGRLARKGDRVAPGDTVEIARAPESDDDRRPLPEAMTGIDVLHLDDDLVAINKPAALATHPLGAGETGTAANWLMATHPETDGIGDDRREAGWVHRLDRGTSGVLLAARNRQVWLEARELFRRHRVEKVYLALVTGSVEAGGSSAPLARRGSRTVVDEARGLDAETRWSVQENLGDATLLRCTAATGRMHQVRAHLAHAGHPIEGDELYGGGSGPDLDAHFLHAASILLPWRGSMLRIEAPLPADREALLRKRRSETA